MMEMTGRARMRAHDGDHADYKDGEHPNED